MTAASPHVPPADATAPTPFHPLEADMPNIPPAITPPIDASLEELERWGYERLGDLVASAPAEPYDVDRDEAA